MERDNYYSGGGNAHEKVNVHWNVASLLIL